MDLIVNAGGIEYKIIGDFDRWNVDATTCCQNEITLIDVRLNASEDSYIPSFKIKWNIPANQSWVRWTPLSGRGRKLPPDWWAGERSALAIGAPVVCFVNPTGNSSYCFAFSDAINPIKMYGGVVEESANLYCCVECFSEVSFPANEFLCTLRLDHRNIRYEQVLRDVTTWWEEMPVYKPLKAPDAAVEPFYSAWYSYHQNISAEVIENECRQAKKYKIQSLIIDDGWHTDDNKRGYAYCGDWKVCKEKIHDMAKHVKKVHKMGLKYLVWYGVPCMGIHSKNYRLFKDKFLYLSESSGSATLDPRFPEVREFLISTLEKSVKDWDLDGLKLDFIDSIAIQHGDIDPAIADDYKGRDIKSIALAIDRLMSDITARLLNHKPDILIEFRQGYIGPAMRKYGNMFRVGDCPYDAVTNRIGMVDLRLISGSTPVHSDMLMWGTEDSAEFAALQLLNVFFCVPQISMRLSEIPSSHAKMLSFWLNVWIECRDTILNGDFRAESPELSYPIIQSEDSTKKIIAVYSPNTILSITVVNRQTIFIINASADNYLYLNLPIAPINAELFTAEGASTTIGTIITGMNKVDLRTAGLIKLYF